MTDNRRFSANGKGRLFAAVAATPFRDADADEKLDLFVCDLLSDADKAEFEERIRRDLELAAAVEQRRIHYNVRQTKLNLDETIGNALSTIRVFAGPRLAGSSDQSSPDQRIRSRSDETKNVSRSGWQPPTWLAIAAAVAILIGIAVVIVNLGERKQERESLAVRNESSGATSATTERPMPAMQESPVVSSPPFEAVIAMDKLPTPAAQMSAALDNALLDPTVAGAKIPTSGARPSPMGNYPPSDAAIALAKSPKPTVRESPAQTNMANWVTVLSVAAILGSEFNDVPKAESDADTIEMERRAAMIAEMYRSTIAQSHPRDIGPRYSVVGIAENDTLNVRSRPSEKSSIVAQLRNGASGIQIERRTVQNRNDDWVRITGAGVKGWVRPRYLTRSGNVETVVEKRKRLALQLGIALGIKLGTRPAAADDLSDSLIKAFGSLSADVYIESTVNEAFPDEPLVRQQVLIATKALFEGDLMLATAGEENQRQEMIAWLQKRSPGAAENAEIIDFLYEVYHRGHSS